MIAFRVQRGDGDRLRTTISQVTDLERQTDRRRFLAGILIVLAVPVWLLALWPHLLPEGDRRFLLLLFGGVLAILLLVLALEWRAAHRLRASLARQPDLIEDAREHADPPGHTGRDGA